MRSRPCADKLNAGSMQSHNLQYAPARYVLHFFHFVKEQTLNNRQTWLVDQEVRQSNEISSSTCLTSRIHIRCTTLHEFWWSWSGSNRRPTACKAAALPAELQPPFFRVLSRASQTNQTKKPWWVWLDSNQRPPPYQDGALTN